MNETDAAAANPNLETVSPSRDDDPELVLDLVRMPDVGAALVCHDQIADRKRLADVLASVGFRQIVQTTRGIEAVEYAAATQPRVALIDVASAGQLGLRAIAAIRSVAPPCAVVLLTPFPALADEARVAGAHAVLDISDLRPLRALLLDLVDHPV